MINEVIDQACNSSIEEEPKSNQRILQSTFRVGEGSVANRRSIYSTLATVDPDPSSPITLETIDSANSTQDSILSHAQHHADGSKMRWLILTLACFIMFGNYYAFDNPSSLNVELKRGGILTTPATDVQDFQYRFSMLYSAYSIPNIILPFFMGHLIDMWGSRRLLIVLSLLVTTGQALTAIGVSRQSFPLILMGRIVFGMGGESLAVAQSRLVTEWFDGKELALALGLNLSIARIGTVVNNIISPLIAESYSVLAAFWVGLFTCILSLFATIVTVSLDCLYRVETLGRYRNNSSSDLLPKMVHPQKTRYWGRSVKPAFFLVVSICFLFYGCMVPYNNVASDYLQTRYFKESILESNAAMSIPDTLAMFLVPLLGWYVDWTGSRLVVLFAGSLAFILGHSLLALGTHGLMAIFALITLSLGYSSLLACWACVPCLVKPARHSLAYGILTSSCNLAVTVVSLMVAPIVASDPTYFKAGIFFVTLGTIALLVVLTLWVLNGRDDLNLDKTVQQLIPSKAKSVMVPTLAEMTFALPSEFIFLPDDSRSCSTVGSCGSIPSTPTTPLG